MGKNVIEIPPRSMQGDPKQGELFVDRQIETDGIGMGVLQDGTAFLSQRGLARLCGVENRYIGLISAEWDSDKPSERTLRVREILSSRGELASAVVYETKFRGRRVLAYPDQFCMAVLEYYAFEAALSGKDTAVTNYRRLAAHGLRQFIYSQVGYTSTQEPDVWRIFRDRVSQAYDSVPSGYFSVFKEISSLIVTLGLNGLHISERFVPDISVGQVWAKHWDDGGLTEAFGSRLTYPHHYPSYFPQAASNPQMVACYPEAALGEFRRWFREDYICNGRLQVYLTKKAGELFISRKYIERATLALTNGGGSR